jgi:sigma-E factor negative regulatory protein RseC
MEPGVIIHPGIIESITDDKILVRILSQSACSSCHAKGACSISEVEEKIIEIDHFSPGGWQKGQSVMVRMQQSLGLKAVFLGYFAPLLVLVGSVVLFLNVLKNEGLAALISILMLAPYYGILYLFRSRLRKKFSFTIDRVEQEEATNV